MQIVTNLLKLPLDRIHIDRGTQCRDLSDPAAKYRHQRVRDNFVQLMKAEGEWDFDRSPPVVFGPIEIEGRAWYLPGDGHTRIEAAKLAGKTSILCELKPGTLRDAILYSIGPANKFYLSCALTKADLDKRVRLALADREMWCWIDSRISQWCDDGTKKVSHFKVRKMRSEYLASIEKIDPHEYEWRIRQLSFLKAIDKKRGEFIVGRSKSNGKHLGNDATLSVNVIRDLPHAACAIARTRAAESDVPLEQWIGATILAADELLKERDALKLEIIRLRSLLGGNFTPNVEAIVKIPACPRYIYTGPTAEYDILGNEVVSVTIIPQGTILELIEVTGINFPQNSLTVRPSISSWQTNNYLIVPIDRLEWLAPNP